MVYSLRTVSHGISSGYKAEIDPTTGQPATTSPIIVPITGLVSVADAPPSATTIYADNTTQAVTSSKTIPLTVNQYQFNHAQMELAFNGYTYDTTTPPTQTDWTVSNTGAKPQFAFWFITEVSDGTEQLIVYPNCTASDVTGIGSGSTDTDSVTVNTFSYTATAGQSVDATLPPGTSRWFTSDPTTIAAAKAGTYPTFP